MVVGNCEDKSGHTDRVLYIFPVTIVDILQMGYTIDIFELSEILRFFFNYSAMYTLKSI